MHFNRAFLWEVIKKEQNSLIEQKRLKGSFDRCNHPCSSAHVKKIELGLWLRKHPKICTCTSCCRSEIPFGCPVD